MSHISSKTCSSFQKQNQNMSSKLLKGDIIVYAKNGHKQQAEVMLIAGDDVMIELVADRRVVHTLMSNIYSTQNDAVESSQSSTLLKGDIVVYSKNGHEQQAEVMLIAGGDVTIELVADRRVVYTVMSNIYRTSRAAMDLDQ
jgi:hypothetical protein